MANGERPRPTRGDLLWSAALTVGAQIELTLDAGSVEGSLLRHRACFLLVTLSLAIWRPTPLLAAALCGVGLGAVAVVGVAPIASGILAALLLLVRIGFGCPLRSGAVALALLLVASGVPLLANGETAADLVVNGVVLAGAWAAAAAARRSADRLVVAEVEKQQAARLAVLTERGRIARDLHDSVAHAVTVMTLTAGGARQHTEEAHTSSALSTVETTGRQALSDLHRFLGLLGSDVAVLDEAPGLADLGDLVDGARAAGARVELLITGAVSLAPPSIGTTAYRVVQESLTNVLKHCAAPSARVVLDIDRESAVVRVTSPLAVDVARPRASSGHGLAGLRSRTAVFHGEFDAGPRDDSWVVEARLPYAGATG